MSGDSQEYDKASVNLWVEPEQKERWQAYLEDQGDLQHMSQLVRRAVENEISGRSTPTIPDNHESQLTEVVDAVDAVSETVDQLVDRLDTIEQAVQDDFDMRDLANRVFTVLPTAEEIEAAGSRSHDVGESADGCGTLSEIAATVDESEQHVRQALEQLRQDTAQVQTTVLDGKTRYYKEG